MKKNLFFPSVFILSLILLASFGIKSVDANINSSSNCTISGTLQMGSIGNSVTCLQQILGLSADGDFGPITKAAVLTWQAKNDLTADGVFGPKSLQILMDNNSLITTPISTYRAGCTTTSNYSTTTGQPCGTTTVIVGCASGDLYNSLTGQACVVTTTTPVITSISPTSGPVGTQVTITGSGFTSTDNSINFGGGYINGLDSNGTNITFSVPNSLGFCPPSLGGVVKACPMLERMVNAGSYDIFVENINGTSDTLSFAVTSILN